MKYLTLLLTLFFANAFAGNVVSVEPITLSGLTAGNATGRFSDEYFIPSPEGQAPAPQAGDLNILYTDSSEALAEDTIPAGLENHLAIQTKDADKASTGSSLITFTPDGPVQVCVWHDDDLARPTWLTTGFTDSNLNITVADSLDVMSGFCASFAADGLVTLGGNTTAGGTEPMYYVSYYHASFAIPVGAASDPAGEYQYTAATSQMNESSAQTRGAAQRINGSNGAVTVDRTDLLTGTCSSGSDYDAISDTEAAWADTIDDSVAGFSITANAVSADCTIILGFTNAAGGISAASTLQTQTITVIDAGAISAVYVATDGDNGDPGTESEPWLTVNYAVDNASPGDTIFVRGGTYNERVTIGVSGTAGNYITLTNYEGETAIMSGSGLGNGTMIRAQNIDYYKIIGLEIKNHTGAGINFWENGSHIEIRDNWIHDQSFTSGDSWAINVSAADPGAYNTEDYLTGNLFEDIVIDNNTLGPNVNTGSGSNFNECLTVAWNVKRFQITNNTLDDCSHIGIDAIGKNSFGGSTVPAFPQYGRIAGNTFKNSGFQATLPVSGFHGDGVKDLVLEDNIFRDSEDYGYDLNSEPLGIVTERIITRRNQSLRMSGRGIHAMGFSGAVDAVRHAHNSVYMTSSNGIGIALDLGTDTIIKNNISQVGDSAGDEFALFHDHGTTSSPTLDYNLYYPGDAFYQYKGTFYTGATAFADYVSATGQDANSSAADPEFADPANNDLTPGANAIDDGGCLTETNGTGSTSDTLIVDDAQWFHDGMGIEGLAGDTIRVGADTVVVDAVVYATDTITMTTSISWGDGECVSYPYNGSFPDIGAIETTP